MASVGYTGCAIYSLLMLSSLEELPSLGDMDVGLGKLRAELSDLDFAPVELGERKSAQQRLGRLCVSISKYDGRNIR